MSSTINPRLLGLVVGLGVGALFSAGVLITRDLGLTFSPEVILPVLLSAAVGGWVMGPKAVAPQTRRGWTGVVLALAVVAILLGDGLVVAGLAWQSAWSIAFSWSFIPLLASMATLMVVGLVVVGWLALPFTLLGALIWTASMRALSVRCPAGGRAG